jgi:hypothetical protein
LQEVPDLKYPVPQVWHVLSDLEVHVTPELHPVTGVQAAKGQSEEIPKNKISMSKPILRRFKIDFGAPKKKLPEHVSSFPSIIKNPVAHLAHWVSSLAVQLCTPAQLGTKVQAKQ